MLAFVFPRLALAAGETAGAADLLPSRLLVPLLFLATLGLSLASAFLGPGHARTRRSLSLLAGLTSLLGALTQLLSLPLGSGLSLVAFLGIFAVIYLMGRFDAPE